ncbi:LysR family transcriptional regulator [Fusibacter ferrireducens]|uniref:LysR family transcriptional regulator n=1 Tax=Fusibacter ferrireducens TaxID=2785058 RepID=A0ABR9ZWV9_9FIRM|nr:LysR family transcriptional regulator [Fusibacter ferrireducens]MBF4694099.1 LysR family transcriptional regulator [Fusibacter ferrireducens]
MRLADFKYIRAVVEEGNISRAASKLYISQPSLSNAIKKIEQDLGASIFYRTKNGLVLTHIGTKYFMMANSVLKIYADFENEIQDIEQLANGRIHFGITNYVGSLLLPSLLPTFSDMAPNIDITFEENHTMELIEKLKLGKIDLAVLHIDKVQNDDASFNFNYIKSSRFLLATQKNHPICLDIKKDTSFKYPAIDLKLLENERFILTDHDQMSRTIARRIFRASGITPTKTLITRNILTASKLAESGFGVTFFPEMYLKLINFENNIDLYTVGDDSITSWDLVVATLNNDYQPRATTAFIELIKDLA